MKVLTVKQPWAYLICSGIKDIENRTWPTKFSGRILIHASAKPANKPYMILNDEQCKAIEESGKGVDFLQSYTNGSQIIGSVEIVNCVKGHSSIWAEKDAYNWVLANPILFEEPITNIKGKLGLWNYDK